MITISYYFVLSLIASCVLCANATPNYPSPQGGRGTSPVDDDWNEAYEKAKAFVSDLTLIGKLNLTSGVGYTGLADAQATLVISHPKTFTDFVCKMVLRV